MNIWDFCNPLDICLEEKEHERCIDNDSASSSSRRDVLTPLEWKKYGKSGNPKTDFQNDMLNSRRSLKRPKQKIENRFTM